MITAKFGGTAVTPSNLIYIKRIVGQHHNFVVVSAVGKEYAQDDKTTDLLLRYFDTRDSALWDKIAQKYRRLTQVNGVDIDIDSLLEDARARVDAFDRNYCASLGEELSARVVARFLGAKYIEAEDIVRFKDGQLDAEQTYRNIAEINGGELCVVGGFYGGCKGGRQTFSRGGSDVTGAIFARASNASLYENWTDVDGVCVADPFKVSATRVETLSYAEMRLLALAGAEVLHPDAVSPVEEAGIPIKIGNFFRPEGEGTLVSHCPSRNKLLSVAEKRENEHFVTTVLHGYPRWEILSKLSRFLKSVSRVEDVGFAMCEVCDVAVLRIELSDGVLRIVSKQSLLQTLYPSLLLD